MHRMLLIALLAAACGGAAVPSTSAPATTAPAATSSPVTTAPLATSSPATTAPLATSSPVPASEVAAGGCADVVGADFERVADGTYRFSVTVASTDTGWEKYADAWEVVAPDGSVLGTRVLTHPHVDEQPFTRSQSGIVVPGGVSEVTVRVRDSVNGFCGQERMVALAP